MSEHINPAPEQPQDPEAYPPTQEGFVWALDDTVVQHEAHISNKGGSEPGQIPQVREELKLYTDPRSSRSFVKIMASGWSGPASRLTGEGHVRAISFEGPSNSSLGQYSVFADGTVRDATEGLKKPDGGRALEVDALESVDYGTLIERIRGATPVKPRLAAKLGFVAGGRGRQK